MSTSTDSINRTNNVRRSLKTVWVLGLFVFVVYVILASGRIVAGDGGDMFHVTISIVDHHAFNIDPCGEVGVWCSPGLNGKHFSAYGIAPTVAAIPAYVGGILLGHLIHKPSILIAGMLVSFENCLLGALTVIFIFLWAERLGFTRRCSLFLSLLVAFATPVLYFSTKGFYSEAHLALGLTLSAYSLRGLRPKGNAWVAGLALGFACASRLFAIALLPSFAYYLWQNSLRVDAFKKSLARHALTFGGGLLIFLFIIAAYNYVRFGSIKETGYSVLYPTLASTFNQPFLLGIWREFFNGEVGLIWYCPILLLIPFTTRSFCRHLPIETIFIGSVAVVTIVFFAKFSEWHGGWAYGPRYIEPIIPLVMVMLGGICQYPEQWWTAPRRLLLGTSIAVATFLQIVAMPNSMERYYFVMDYNKINNRHTWSDGSCLLYDFRSMPVLFSRDSIAEAQRSIRSTLTSTQWSAAHGGRVANNIDANTEQEYISSLPHGANLEVADFWLLKLVFIRVPIKAVLALAVLLVAVASFLGFRLIKIARNSAVTETD